MTVLPACVVSLRPSVSAGRYPTKLGMMWPSIRLGVVGLVLETLAAVNAPFVGMRAVRPAALSSSAVRLDTFVRAVKVL